jgi:hypothetical protein
MAEFSKDWQKRFNVNKFTSEDKKYIKQGKSLAKIKKARMAELSSSGHTPAEITDIMAAEGAVHTRLIDGSDAKANAGFTVSFEHVPSEKQVYFKSFLTAFNETYKPEWSSETVYGRADPIYMYKNTTRSISVGLVLPAATFGEGFENMGKLQELIQFLYPTYMDANNALTITQSPLIRLKIMNIITKQGVEDGTDKLVQNNNVNQIINSNNASDGLLGVVQNLSINYNVDNPDMGSFEVAKGTIIPKAIEINFDFNVIHEHHLGWDKEGNFSNQEFPYNINTNEAQEDAQKHMKQYAKGQAAAAKLAARELTNKLKVLRDQQAKQDNWLARTLNATSRAMGSKRPDQREKRWYNEYKSTANQLTQATNAAQAADAQGRGDGPGNDSAADVAALEFIDS